MKRLYIVVEGQTEESFVKELLYPYMAFDNPETINSSPQGAPSKRLIAIKPDYDKVMEGNLIALEIGLEAILERCPRFRTWTDKLIERCTNI